MKTKLLTLTLLVCLMLSACGKQEEPKPTNEPTNEVVEEIETTTTSEPIEEVEPTPTNEPIEEVEPTPTNEPIEEESGSEIFSNSYQLQFPNDIEAKGFTDKFVYKEDETWSLNFTHFVAPNGNEMNFVWDGPVELGKKAQSGEKTLYLYGDDTNYSLYAWSSSLSNLDKAIKNYDKEIIVTVDSSVSYSDGDYYELIDEETYDKVIFKITFVIDDVEYTGYAVYMDDYTTMTTYQFNYLERSDMFDDTRALHIANSLDFWLDYVSEE